MGYTHPKGLSESFLMDTNMIGFGCFSKIVAIVCFGQSSLSIGRVKKKGIPSRFQVSVFNDISR